jgi:hypothetical protein
MLKYTFVEIGAKILSFQATTKNIQEMSNKRNENINSSQTVILKNLNFSQLYIYYCSKDGLEPISSIVQNAERNVFDLDLDFLPENHLKQISLALTAISTGRSSIPLNFKDISLRWHERNDARHLITNKAFQTIKPVSNSIVKDSMFLRDLQSVQKSAKRQKNFEATTSSLARWDRKKADPQTAQIICFYRRRKCQKA